MDVIETAIPDVKLLKPKLFGDERGFFMESYNQKTLQDLCGLDVDFVQDNHSRSTKNVLRGLHYQMEQAQGKLVRVVSGEVFDVAVDLRQSSATFGQWAGTVLSGQNHHQFYVPPGFAHGFVVLSDTADFLYKTTDYYAPQYEKCIRWDDPDIGIEWPMDAEPSLSEKDKAGVSFQQAVYYD
ncbi:MAG: dTDP-4-dehydrorhamnose 3,5-epimerase [Piscirickettsiaceae bacterium]|jgi:dTDP-4-dehydrorhamnose 3,5-epimerase|nr:dTDP-4-dehydrorhamnose 3,5-epimerase [Piscirickettsiaceae bacterium]